MRHRRKISILGALAALSCAGLLYAQSQSTDFYTNTAAWSTRAEICHVIPATDAVGLAFYGLHVAQTSGSTVYVGIFPNTIAKPTNGTVIPGGGWSVSATSDRDINAVQAGVPMGGANQGMIACLSTTQGTYTAATAVGWFWVLYKGRPGATPTETPTPTATPT